MNLFRLKTSVKVDFLIPFGPKIQIYYCLFGLTIGGTISRRLAVFLVQSLNFWLKST